MAKKRPSASSAAASGLDFELDVSNLREVLGSVKEFSPALARKLRKELRGTGDDIIADQQRVLDGPLPPGVAVTGKRTRLIVPKDGSKPYFRRVNVYEERERAANNRTSRGMRQGIKRSLKTRVVAGKTRQGVQVRANSKTSDMTHAWQAKIFRHPVFSHTGKFVHQRGQQYFWGPAVRGRDRAAIKVDQAIAQALTEMSKGSS
jgi:hypothetical protein